MTAHHTVHASLSGAKQHLGELAKRVAYGGERVVLEFRGKPLAAIVSYDDLMRLNNGEWTDRSLEALQRLDELRKRVRARSGVQPDSAPEIARMRDEREQYLANLP